MKNSTNDTAPQPALLFIPDISGFTRFVTDTEIGHSQHIIEELLETMIDANDLGLEISEIEGDAILFYRFGAAPTAVELLAQVQRMFVRFHTHLKKYETHRICQCGACKSANDLTLKFIAHYGDISLNNVKQYRKLFGKEVIVAHRLMKNSIEHHEYAMVTNQLVKACPQWVDVDTVAWAPVQHGQEEYDSGKVSFCYLPLAPLMGQVPELTAEDYSISGVKTSVVKCVGEVAAPLEMVFNVFADLPWRSKWLVGAKPEVDQLNHKVFQSGATHNCLVNGPVIVSHDFETAEDLITFTETDVKKTTCAIYTLRKLGPNRTRVEAEWFIRRNPFKKWMFNLLAKKKFKKRVDESLHNLNAYCQGLLAEGKEHAYRIVLPTGRALAA